MYAASVKIVSRYAPLALLAFCMQQALGAPGCRSVWSSNAESSPDGKWIAEVHKYLCDGGLGAAEEEDVELRLAHGLHPAVTVLSPWGQWTKPEEVRLRWLNSAVLEISVPNRTTFGTRLAQFHGILIKLRYENDNPADRARWMAWLEKNKEWVKGLSQAPQPRPPPQP